MTDTYKGPIIRPEYTPDTPKPGLSDAEWTLIKALTEGLRTSLHNQGLPLTASALMVPFRRVQEERRDVVVSTQYADSEGDDPQIQNKR